MERTFSPHFTSKSRPRVLSKVSHLIINKSDSRRLLQSFNFDLRSWILSWGVFSNSIESINSNRFLFTPSRCCCSSIPRFNISWKNYGIHKYQWKEQQKSDGSLPNIEDHKIHSSVGVGKEMPQIWFVPDNERDTNRHKIDYQITPQQNNLGCLIGWRSFKNVYWKRKKSKKFN